MKKNKYQYKVNEGYVTGFFNIYQARNGKIYIMLSDNVTPLTLKQVEDLKINVYVLDEYDHNSFKKAYDL